MTVFMTGGGFDLIENLLQDSYAPGLFFKGLHIDDQKE